MSLDTVTMLLADATARRRAWEGRRMDEYIAHVRKEEVGCLIDADVLAPEALADENCAML